MEKKIFNGKNKRKKKWKGGTKSGNSGEIAWNKNEKMRKIYEMCKETGGMSRWCVWSVMEESQKEKERRKREVTQRVNDATG